MKQENMNNKMEQNSKENEVTKNEVAETEAMPCNATNNGGQAVPLNNNLASLVTCRYIVK